MQNAHFWYSQSLKFVSNSFLFIFCICRDFEIYYQLPQSTETGKRPDVFLSLTSDFDLDAAFMSSSLPYLSLKVEPIISSGEYCTLCNRALSESYTATLLEVLFLFKSHFLAFCSQTEIIIIYLTQFVLRFLIRFLICFLLVVLFVHFYCPFTPANFMENFYTSNVHIYIFVFYFTTHLIMTEGRSKRRVLPLVFIVKNLFLALTSLV